MGSFRSKPRGWARDNYRHYLAAKFGAAPRRYMAWEHMSREERLQVAKELQDIRKDLNVAQHDVLKAEIGLGLAAAGAGNAAAITSFALAGEPPVRNTVAEAQRMVAEKFGNVGPEDPLHFEEWRHDRLRYFYDQLPLIDKKFDAARSAYDQKATLAGVGAGVGFGGAIAGLGLANRAAKNRLDLVEPTPRDLELEKESDLWMKEREAAAEKLVREKGLEGARAELKAKAIESKKYHAKKGSFFNGIVNQSKDEPAGSEYRRYKPAKGRRIVENIHDGITFVENGRRYSVSPDNDTIAGGKIGRDARPAEERFIRGAPLFVLKKHYGDSFGRER